MARVAGVLGAAGAVLSTHGAHAQTLPGTSANGPGTSANGSGASANGDATRLPPIVARDVLPGVLERARPGYDAVGVRLGGFRLTPQVNVAGFYNTNIYALNNNRIADGGIRITPDVKIASTWGRHALALDASSTILRYASRTIENSESVAGTLSGRLDVDRDTQLVPSITLARRIQTRGTVDEVLIGLTDPIAYRELSSALTAQHRFGELVMTLGGTAAEFRYEDTRLNGQRIRLRDNNSRAYGANARLLYQLGPAVGLFAQGSYSAVRYVPATRFPDRSSNGFSVLGGVAFGLTPLLTGEIGLGYISQDFNAPVFGDVSSLDYAFKLDWLVSPLIDVHADVGRTFQRSPFLGAAGVRLDTATFSVNYEVLRNLTLETGLAYSVNDYQGLSRSERRLGGTMTARYLANRNLSLFATVDATRQRRAAASALGRDYERAVFSAGARLQL